MSLLSAIRFDPEPSSLCPDPYVCRKSIFGTLQRSRRVGDGAGRRPTTWRLLSTELESDLASQPPGWPRLTMGRPCRCISTAILLQAYTARGSGVRWPGSGAIRIDRRDNDSHGQLMCTLN